jgi:hypothetical protein
MEEQNKLHCDYYDGVKPIEVNPSQRRGNLPANKGNLLLRVSVKANKALE